MTSSIEGDVSMEGEAAQVEVGDREEVSLADGAGISSANTVSVSMAKEVCAANGELESAGFGASTIVNASVASDAGPHVEKGQEETTDSTNLNNGHDGSSKPQVASSSVKSGPSKKKRGKRKKGSGPGGAAGPGPSLVEGGVNADGDSREEDGERDGDSTDAVKTADNSRAAVEHSALGAQAPQSGAAGGNGAVGTGAAGNPATGAVAGATAGGGIPSEEEIIRMLRNKELERRRAKAGGAQAPFKEHKIVWSNWALHSMPTWYRPMSRPRDTSDRCLPFSPPSQVLPNSLLLENVPDKRGSEGDISVANHQSEMV